MARNDSTKQIAQEQGAETAYAFTNQSISVHTYILIQIRTQWMKYSLCVEIGSNPWPTNRQCRQQKMQPENRCT